jgi:hypothetical protein
MAPDAIKAFQHLQKYKRKAQCSAKSGIPTEEYRS